MAVRIQSTKEGIPPDAQVIFAPHPGPQTEALLALEDEILTGGSKSGGKSKICQAFVLRGNPDVNPYTCPADISYVLDRNYRALVLRRNYKDMTDWLDSARGFFEDPRWDSSMRARPYHKEEQYFEWPSGARCYVDHYADSNAYQKQKGRGVLHRLIIEELTDTCPDEERYWQIYSCLRSLVHTPQLRCQVMCSTNPEGDGLLWVMSRWMTDPVTGKDVPPGTRIEQVIKSPLTGKVKKVSRIFIPFKITDNPSVDPMYEFRLSQLPEHLRNAYLEGKFGALDGSVFFPEFRENAKPDEPEGAVHVISPDEVMWEDWEPVIASLDWGFAHKAIFYFGSEKTGGKYDGRFIVREELVRRRISDEELGREFAVAALKYFNEKRMSIQLFVPPEIFAKYATVKAESIAGRIEMGIEQVLGEKAVKVLQTEKDFMTQAEFQREMRVVMRPANNQRKHGWGIVRQMLDWSVLRRDVPKFDPNYAIDLATRDSQKYFRYMEMLQRIQGDQKVPRLLIERGKAPELVAGIKRARTDKDGDVLKEDCDVNTGAGGDDAIDSLRYLCVGAQAQRVKEPKEVWLLRQMALHQALYGPTNIESKMAAHRMFEREYGGKKVMPFRTRRRIA